MSKPDSIKVQPWATFGRQSYSLVTDDFVHDKLLTVKVNQIPSRGGINLKQQIQRKHDSEVKYKGSGEIKLWFPFRDTYAGQLYFRSKSDGIKLHYDNGKIQWKKWCFESLNFYGSIQSNKKFQHPIIKIGGKLFGDGWTFDSRLRFSFENCCQLDDVSVGHKFSWAKNNWFFDSYKVVSLKNLALLSNAFRIGYKFPKHDIFFRAQNNTKRPIKGFNFSSIDAFYTKFYFDFVHKINNDIKFGIEGEASTKNSPKLLGVYWQRFPNRNIAFKGRISTEKKCAFSVLYDIQKNLKLTAGTEISEIGGENKIKCGVQAEFNL